MEDVGIGGGSETMRVTHVWGLHWEEDEEEKVQKVTDAQACSFS